MGRRFARWIVVVGLLATAGCATHYEYLVSSLDGARQAVKAGARADRVAVMATSLDDSAPTALRFSELAWDRSRAAASRAPGARWTVRGPGSRGSRACGWATLTAGLLHEAVFGAMLAYDRATPSVGDGFPGVSYFAGIPIAIVGGGLLLTSLGCLADGYAERVDVDPGRAGWLYVGTPP